MNFKFFILSIGLSISSILMAQDTRMKSFSKIDFGFSGLGVSYETPLSEKFLFEVGAGLGAGYIIDNETFNYTWYLDDPSAFLSVHGKYVYNRHTRVKKGKSLNLNSGNFWGLKMKYTTPTLRYSFNSESLLIGLHWGIQRQLSSHFSYQLQTGLGYGLDVSQYNMGGRLFPDINIRFSYVLPF